MTEQPQNALEFLKGGEHGVYEIHVLRCNMRAVQAFQLCQMTFAGMSGVCLGISMSEISSVLDVLGVKGRRRETLSRQLVVMSRAAEEYHNAMLKEK